MSYNCGSNFDPNYWYETMMDRRTREALREQRAAFEAEYKDASNEALLAVVRKRAGELGHTPHMAEVLGAGLMCRRFGSWRQTLDLVGLSHPCGADRLKDTKLYKTEYVRQQQLYRAEKQAKKEARLRRLQKQKQISNK